MKDQVVLVVEEPEIPHQRHWCRLGQEHQDKVILEVMEAHLFQLHNLVGVEVAPEDQEEMVEVP
jgi:hypothetical protein